MKVINLFAGPGAGKSTIASGLFYHIKNNRLAKCELVHEYAKDLTYGKDFMKLSDQLLVTANQNHRLLKLEKSGIEIAISDSPLILGLMYFTDNNHLHKDLFRDLLISVFNSYNNINIFLERNPDIEYEQYGRNQTYEEAIQKDREIKDFLNKYDIPYTPIKRDENTIQKIAEFINTFEKLS